MLALRRAAASPLKLPLRQKWHQLSAFAETEVNASSWKELKLRELKAQTIVDRYQTPQSVPSIDWKAWEREIGHKDLVKNLKNFYDHQAAILSKAIGEDHVKAVEEEKAGWELFEAAVVSCEKSVEKSEGLVDNAAKALWISYNNPPIWQVDANEWVESDQYWQAYIEKHHYYNPNPSGDDPESPAEIEARKSSWHSRVAAFNERSDTPILYCYMDQLPSWEYYDIHRRALLEHMTYYLLRTGGDYRLFPECPPWQWLTDIEDLRYRFIAVAQRRRASFQLKNEELSRALDVQPLDYDHYGQSFHAKFLQSEARLFEQTVGRLMGNYCFLVHPFVPIQSFTALVRALGADEGKGRIFSLGDDVNALFYLPAKNLGVPRPKECLHFLMDHLALTGRRFNPGYAALMDAQTDILEKRGEHWLTMPGESVADQFLRRLNPDDAAFPVYEVYIQDMKSRFSQATEISREDAFKKIDSIEKTLHLEEGLHHLYVHSVNTEVITEGKQEVESLLKMNKQESLSYAFAMGSSREPSGLVLLSEGEQVHTHKDGNSGLSAHTEGEGKEEGSELSLEASQRLLDDVAMFESEKELVAEYVKKLKIPDIEKALEAAAIASKA